MRKTPFAVSVPMMLLCLALPAWGESPSAGAPCPVASATQSTPLPDVTLAPIFRTLVCDGIAGHCGGCSGVCSGRDPGCSCATATGESGTCTGFQVGSNYEYCPLDSPRPAGYRCVCMAPSD